MKSHKKGFIHSTIFLLKGNATYWYRWQPIDEDSLSKSTEHAPL